MSTKRYGNRVLSDLSKAILFIIKKGATNNDEVADLLSGSYSDKQIRRRIASLKYNKFLGLSSNDEISLTSKGFDALDNLGFRTIVDSKPWDGLWRVVIYDIPEDKRVARNKIRQLLKDLGFRQLQMSVWAHPLPCLKQFHTIRKAYGIDHHLLLFEIKDSNDFKDIKTQFTKLYPQINYH